MQVNEQSPEWRTLAVMGFKPKWRLDDRGRYIVDYVWEPEPRIMGTGNVKREAGSSYPQMLLVSVGTDGPSRYEAKLPEDPERMSGNT